jgi:hypothetical protein
MNDEEDEDRFDEAGPNFDVRHFQLGTISQSNLTNVAKRRPPVTKILMRKF